MPNRNNKQEVTQPSEANNKPQVPARLARPGDAPKEYPAPTHKTPRIALFDLPQGVADTLSEAGLNVTEGSLGIPYKVEKSSGYQRVVPNHSQVANLREQDIVVIDLDEPEPVDRPNADKLADESEPHCWAKTSFGVVDPRPFVMWFTARIIDLISKNGGVIVVFADDRCHCDLVWGQMDRRSLEIIEPMDIDNWSFLPNFRSQIVKIIPAKGSEILINDDMKRSGIGLILQEHLEGAEYACTLASEWLKDRDRWLSIATDRFGDDVAAVLLPDKEEGDTRSIQEKGLIFIFPQVKDKGLFLKQFFLEYLSGLIPALFPFVENQPWIHQAQYELPKVLQLRNKIATVQAEAKQRVLELERQIEEAQSADGYLYDLLRETGDKFKNAVIKALNTLGFTSVVDVDEEGSKDEDLWITDKSPTLLVEVKGINGTPKDDDVLQVGKHLAPRMKEWKRTDVQGLVIINHQRNIPPLARDEQPFRELLVTDAKSRDITLLTAWDLYRLVRGFLAHGWKPEHIKPLFYVPGEMVPVPLHYQLCGEIENYWPKAEVVGIRVEGVTIRRGDRIAFGLPHEYIEQTVDSLQVENVNVEEAQAGDLAGVKTLFTKDQMHKRTVVYRVAEST